METLYIKNNKKYIRIGTTSSVNYQPDGLWLFQTHESSHECNNIGYRISKLPQPVEVQDYLKAFLNKEIILNVIEELNKMEKIYLNNICLSDLADMIIEKMYLISEKNKNEYKSS